MFLLEANVMGHVHRRWMNRRNFQKRGLVASRCTFSVLYLLIILVDKYYFKNRVVFADQKLKQFKPKK